MGVLVVLGIILTWTGPVNDTARAVQSTVGSIASMIAAVATIVSLKDEYRD
jgi:hypothetical protein